MTMNKTQWNHIKETAEKLHNIKEELDDLFVKSNNYQKIEITEEFDQEVLGVPSIEREEYDEISKQINEKRKEESETHHEFLELITRLIFPIEKEKIEKTGDSWKFPFSDDEGIFVKELNSVLHLSNENEILQSNDVIIYKNQIEVKTEDKSQAMESIINVIKEMKEKAKALLDIKDIAESLTNKRLEVLKVIDQNSPISYSDISLKVTGEKGAIRGFFYRLLDPPSLIKKDERGFYLLTNIGKNALNYLEKNKKNNHMERMQIE